MKAKKSALLLGLMLLAQGKQLPAQILLGAEDLVVQMGQVRVMAMATAQQPLSALAIGVGVAGGPQVFDLSQAPAGTTEGGVFATTVLPPEQAPGHEQYPQADYALLSQGPVGTMEDTYLFVEETPAGSRILGVSGGEPSGPLAQILTQAPAAVAGFLPLTLGKRFAPIQIPLDLEVAGIRMSGAMTIEGEVDAWGTVVVPAGRFEALRLHQWGGGSLALAAAGQDTMRFTEQIEQYSWLTPGVGQLAFLQEVTVVPPAETGVPAMATTQISRLLSFQPGTTVVSARTWGQVKAGR